MPSELIRMLNLDLLCPTFLYKLLSCIAECREGGAEYKCYSGYRSFEEQTQLYEKYLRGGARAAPPGLSAHNYGIAVDCARLRGKLVSWKPEDYGTLREIAPKHGLITGAAFGDEPHLQLAGFVSGVELTPLKKAYLGTYGTELEKLQAAWKLVEVQHDGV